MNSSSNLAELDNVKKYDLIVIGSGAGLEVGSVSGVAPGRYGVDVPVVEHPELLLLASRPGR